MNTRNTRIYSTAFADVYPLYIKKAERKGRTKDEVDAVICWLTGYTEADLKTQIARQVDFTTFFSDAPQINANVQKITGVVCGIRVETIEEP